MTLLDVSTPGLRTLAAACESWSTEIAGLPAPDAVPASVQATTAAVGAIDTNVHLSATSMAARMNNTAAKLRNAGRDYLAGDLAAAARLCTPSEAAIDVDR